MTLYEFDNAYSDKGFTALCGVDEAGRGPLAGPVYAAAVILPPGVYIDGLNDSKKLPEKKRECVYGEIISCAAAYSVGIASREEIDEINILNASLLAMKRAVEGLSIKPDCVLVDGNTLPDIEGIYEAAIVGGDGVSAAIAAASVIAKVERDHNMYEMDKVYPCYQFGRHKGYGTKLHYEMLDEFGPSPIHRVSFLKKWTAARAL